MAMDRHAAVVLSILVGGVVFLGPILLFPRWFALQKLLYWLGIPLLTGVIGSAAFGSVRDGLLVVAPVVVGLAVMYLRARRAGDLRAR